jgi:hypothetical protein
METVYFSETSVFTDESARRQTQNIIIIINVLSCFMSLYICFFFRPKGCKTLRWTVGLEIAKFHILFEQIKAGLVNQSEQVQAESSRAEV